MVEKKQFSIRWMLIEITLLGVSFAAFRWCFFTNHVDDSALEALLLPTIVFPGGVGFFGAAVGGLFGSFRRGAICAVVSVFVFYLLGSLFLPTVTY